MKWKCLHGCRLSVRLPPNGIPECSNLFSHLLLRPALAVVSGLVAVDQRHLFTSMVFMFENFKLLLLVTPATTAPSIGH